MEILFKGNDLERIYSDAKFDGGYSLAVVKAYRKRVGFIAKAVDERDIRNIKGNHLEKLSGRDNQFSARINDQWRLILSFETIDNKKTAVLLAIEDYH